MKKTAYTVLASLIVEAVICCGEPKKAQGSTNDPSLGGCIVKENLASYSDPAAFKCKLSAQPTVVLPLSAVDLKTSTLFYGLQAINPGICYGVTYAPTEWYASGGAFCLNVGRAETGNIVFPSGIAQLARWGVLGVGSMCSEGFSASKKLTCHALLLFGVNVPIT